MLDLLTNHIYELAAVAIAGLAATRLYYGDRFYEIPWHPLRVTIIPLAHGIAKRTLGEEYYTTYDVDPVEHVATLDIGPEDVIDDLEAAGYVVEPLASVKTNWTGTEEAGSYARHRGEKLFPGAPEFLKERQVHVTLFEAPNSGTIVTAHEEPNSWRPDLVEEHYRGESTNIELGRQLAGEDLEIEPTSAPEA